LRVQSGRLLQALDYVGRPLADGPRAAIKAGNGGEYGNRLQQALDPLCLAVVTINPESRVSVVAGAAAARLVEGDWSVFLVKVVNEAGVTAPLRAMSSEKEIEVEVYADRPLVPRLSGVVLEYRILLVKSGLVGPVASVFSFDVGQGSQDIGFRSDLPLAFIARARHPVSLELRDAVTGEPVTAALEIRDGRGASHPAQPKRVEPDFRFHPQIYRRDGESLLLPEGRYTVEVRRGPESIPEVRELSVEAGSDNRWRFEVRRWIDPSKHGWWSGDHHIHAAGCKHYETPSEGVHAEAMYRHCRGEDLKVGANLTWGPCFDYQKQFFTGRVDEVSEYPYLLRYDVEVSGFGSHRSGHLCLLRLKDQIYPGGDSSHHWPTLCLNTLKWAQKQGAVCGPAHSGWGLAVESEDLPNYVVPPFDGIGANEFIVDVTHTVEGPDGTPVPAVDFLSMVDTPYVWELNIWYHTLNCGFRPRISGETDFPCIYGERVGLGRSYVKLDGLLDYDKWCEGISTGRAYVSDGLSHLMDFTVEGVEMGRGSSEVSLERPGPVTVRARVAARLPEQQEVLAETPHARLQREKPDIAKLPYVRKPYWHLERARQEGTRDVRVELVVNGQPVRESTITADGSLRDLQFENVPIERSSWLALRILPSSHTNPVFVVVGGKPVRASRRSAEWCLKSVDQCWSQKERAIAPAESEEAVAAYQHARVTYRRILEECEVD
jgi:hypothetical protein